MKSFLVFTIVYSKINVNECCGNNFAPAIICQHIRENTDFSLQKPEQLLSAEANFEGCLMVKYYMTLILLYCIKR